jgi:hypothetical protein
MGEPAKPQLRTPPTWVKTLVAPLFIISVVLHGLFLLAPVPPPPPPEEETEAESDEEVFVDLLSIQSLDLPEAEPDLPTAPPVAAATPLPAPVVNPNQPVISEAPPDAPPPEQSLAESPLPPEEAPLAADPQAAAPAAYVQEEAAEIFNRLTRGSGDSDFDSTETAFPYAAYSTRQGIQEWSPQEQACFFTQINADTYTPLPNVASLRYLTRNVQFIETQDIPRTFPAPQYQINAISGGYCNRPLFQVFRDGNPFLFISVAGVGVGTPGQQASGLVIIWTSDPRAG